jgi:hypothetical protein
MMKYTDHELRQAASAALALWTALGRDDDDAVERLLPTDAIAYLGSSPGVASRIRDRLGVIAADCTRVGLLLVATLLEDGRLRISFIADVDEGRRSRAVEEGWRFELQLDEGRWLVDPIREHNAHGIAEVELPITPD